ncbi:DUF1385 domain-containing protein [Selenomonadales bacterium OttesenSCG-928-I06]|nr:DUF1385 domain-containing protein [Selenomonadales bacterium OttesenSCG-928-I06]
MSNKPFVGGQAVIEGVMMRKQNVIATAVREPSGNIIVKTDNVNSLSDRYPILKKPMLRGVIALGESLVYGMKALSFSAQVQGDEEEEITTKEIIITMGIALVLGIVLFVIVPTYSAKYISFLTTDPILLNFFEGFLRLGIFIAYIYLISRLKDIERVFEYHGAEHKTIHAYEKGLELNVENIRPFSTIHPRCGTNFLFIVMLISIFVFAFLGWPDLFWRITSRIVLLPVVAGVSYEIIRLAAKHESGIINTLVSPGLYLQYLTTREPNDDQIEVAIKALYTVDPEANVDQEK